MWPESFAAEMEAMWKQLAPFRVSGIGPSAACLVAARRSGSGKVALAGSKTSVANASGQVLNPDTTI